MISSIYHSYDHYLAPEITDAMQQTIEAALDAHGAVTVFFRADDIGVLSKNYQHLMALFLKYQTPLCLAVVPAWMTQSRWEAMAEFHGKKETLFCWHMHGYRHMNHEIKGKKQEFGAIRSTRALSSDLSRGHERLTAIMGKNLTPVFTPPWNRCSPETLMLLKEKGFKAVSRSQGSLPLSPPGLRDFPVHVDLHTRKEQRAKEGWQTLLAEFTTGMNDDACGIMIHHMRMNHQAFIFLEYLLALFAGYKQITVVAFNDLL
ncbi:polysaccharide deacetylase family protein [Desulfobacula sp.]|uniref:polysaccharide deacetylase family protein n=1 Tax=Desulfobacula sp. TaxID=2593537 RepID=UPI002630B10D|nr:polysaccharide deacetylase family protein [Desulfobacula sp.]